MAKKTWVKVSNAWKEVKNVWFNVGGTWKQKVIPKGVVSGVWKEFIQYTTYLYNRGIETVVFNKTVPGGTFIKNTDHYYASISNNTSLPVSSDITIDLTNFNKLKLKLMPIAPLNGSPRIVLAASTTNSHAVPTASTEVLLSSMAVDKLDTIEVDISSLSGNYYVGFHIRVGDYTNANIKVYEIFLE